MARIESKDQISQVQDLPTEEVSVPEWGGEVLVRGLDGRDRDRFLKETIKRDGEKTDVELEDITVRLVARCLVNSAGERLYGDADIAALGKKSGVALARLYKVAQKLSGLDAEEVKAAEKN